MLLAIVVPWALLAFLGWSALKKTREYLAVAQFKRRNGCGEPRKYPHKDPLLGLDLFFAVGKAVKTNRLIDFTRDLLTTYGKTFQINSFGQTIIWTMEPRNIQTVLTSAFDNFGVVPVRAKPSSDSIKKGNPLMSKGIFTADGPIWEHARSLIKPTFSRQQITDFPSLERHFNKFLALIPQDESTVDLKPLLKRLFLDISTEFLFGQSVDCLSPNTPFDSQQFLDSFDISMRGLGERMQLGKFSFIKGKDVRYHEAVKTVHSYIDSHVARVLRDQKMNEPSDQTESVDEPITKRYILLNEMAKETQDPIELRYGLLNVFFPAHDATAIAVSDILFHLAREPRIQSKLRSEIMAATVSGPLSFEILKSIKYLRYIFNESLRLHTLQGRLQRVCHVDTVFPIGGGEDGKSPLLVRKGSGIRLHTQAMHTDPEIWGDDAREFRPERWETARPTWEYIPFGGGPRICPAQQMVFTESAFIVVRLLQEFSNIESQDPEPWTELFRMTVESKNGVKVKLIKA